MDTDVVFIDTEVHVAAGFGYVRGRLQKLAQLCSSGRLRLVTTDVTTREVEAKIQERVAVATSALKRFRDQGGLLRNIRGNPFAGAFAGFNEDTLTGDLVAQLADFHSLAQATTLSAAELSVGPVLDRYFGKRPPFGDQKKKSEFPDAIVVQVLEEWAVGNGATVYVVSNDSDLRACCQESTSLIHIQTIEELLELVAAADNKLAWTVAEESIERCSPAVDAEVRSGFERLGFYLTDQNGDVLDVRVKRVDLDSSHVVDVDGESAWVAMEFTVSFEADVLYDDMSTASYDREDDMHFIHHQIDTTLDRSEEVKVAVELDLNLKDKSAEIVRVDLNRSDVGITAEEWDYD